MGFKENINQKIWGNPDSSVLLYDSNYLLKSPYKSTWLNGDETNIKNPLYMNYRYLMYNGDLPVEIDETICPYGINKNSGIGNEYLMSGYHIDNKYYPTRPVKATTNTAKGQKPAFFTWSVFESPTGQLSVVPYGETLGYLNKQKADGNFKDEQDLKIPSYKYGYSFINNLKYNSITAIPIIIATKKLNEPTQGWNDISTNINGLCYRNSSQPYYETFPYQKQFTVWDYFNSNDTDGIPYTEKYPSILGVYAGIFYSDYEARNYIPNLSINVFSDYTDLNLQAKPEININPVKQMSTPDDVDTSSVTSFYDKPHYQAVIGHNANDYTAFTQPAHDYDYPEINKYTDEQSAELGSFDYANKWNSYVIPDSLIDKVKTGVAYWANSKYTSIAWFEGLTEEECYREIAYLGIPFFDERGYALESAINYIIGNKGLLYGKRFKPDFTDNMITTGLYTIETESKSPLNSIEWLFDLTTSYDPEYVQPDEDVPESSETERPSDKYNYNIYNNSQLLGNNYYSMTADYIQLLKSWLKQIANPSGDFYDSKEDIPEGQQGYLYTTLTNELYKNFNGNYPEESLLSLMVFPFSISENVSAGTTVTPNSYINIGNTDTSPRKWFGNTIPAVVGNQITGNSIIYKTSKPYKIKKNFNDFRDFSPYTSLSLTIPWHGTVDLDLSIWYGHNLTVTLVVDIITGQSVAVVERDGIPVDTISGSVGFPVNLTSINMGDYVNRLINGTQTLQNQQLALKQSNLAVMSSGLNLINNGANFVTGLSTGNVPASVNQGLGLIESGLNMSSNLAVNSNIQTQYKNNEYRFTHMTPSTSVISSASPNVNYGLENSLRLNWRYPVMMNDYNSQIYADTVGFACSKQGLVGDFKGFSVFSNIKVTQSSITDTEQQMIFDLLQTGVIL